MVDISATHFLRGRDHYTNRTPLFEVAGEANNLDNEGATGDEGFSLILGFLDGALTDLRDAADWAREERRSQSRG